MEEEVREIRASAAIGDHVDFPHRGRVFRAIRERADVKTGKFETATACGITGLKPCEAGLEKLIEIVRGHWAIENRLWRGRETPRFPLNLSRANGNVAQSTVCVSGVAYVVVAREDP